MKPPFLKLLLFCLCCFVELTYSQGGRPLSAIIEGQETILYNNSYALVIGNSEYSDAGWDDLPGVKKDLKAIKEVLESNHDFQVEVKENLSERQFENAIEDFIEQYGQGTNDRIIIYYAGHGYTTSPTQNRKEGWLVPVDAPKPSGSNNDNSLSKFRNRALRVRTIRDYAFDIKSKHVLFIFDACFSGTVMRGDPVPSSIKGALANQSRQFISSGTEDQVVQDDPSIFRQELEAALTTKIADASGDSYLTGSELISHLKTFVGNRTDGKQTPLKGHLQDPQFRNGDFVFKLGDNFPKGKKSVFSIEEKYLDTTKFTGYILLNSHLDGNLLIDEQPVQFINAESQYLIKDIPIGYHKLEVRSSKQDWRKRIQVDRNELVEIDTRDITSIPYETPELKENGIFLADSKTLVEGNDNDFDGYSGFLQTDGGAIEVYFGTSIDGMSANQRVLPLLKQGLIEALSNANELLLKENRPLIRSIRIQSTTNGKMSPMSNHYKGTAVDISRINGVRIYDMTEYIKLIEEGLGAPNQIIDDLYQQVKMLQLGIERLSYRRENFGPTLKTKYYRESGKSTLNYRVAGHEGHIHFSVR